MSRQRRKKLLALPILAACLPLLFAAGAVWAQTTPANPSVNLPGANVSVTGAGQGWQKGGPDQIPADSLLKIPIPDVKFTDMLSRTQTVGNKTTKEIDVPWLAQYLIGVYKYAVSIAAVLAAIMMMIGGFQYLTAGDNSSRASQGKERILDAVLGLIIILGAYLILNTVNPDLVSLQGLHLTTISRIEFLASTAGEGPEVEEVSGAAAAASDSVGTPKGDNIFGAGKNIVPIALVPMVEQAAKTLKDQGCALIVTDGFRSMDQQKATIQKHCQNPPGSCRSDGGCKPKPGESTACTLCGLKKESCPHTSGLAIDAWGAKLVAGSPVDAFNGKRPSQACPKESSCDTQEPCVAAARAALRDSGFCLWSGESWHYEVKPGLSKPCN